MTVDIFIRTYSADVEALKYCLRSIDKFCKGFRDVIITIPAKDRHLLGYNDKYIVHTVPHYQNDYLGQQATKLYAHQYSDADLIFFIDSDCVVLKPVTPKSFMKNNKPFQLKTRYSELGNSVPWQSITAKALGFVPQYEYMRRLPLMYWREHLSQLQNAMQIKHTARLESYILNQPHNAFSEFNALGAFCDKWYPDKYEFQDTQIGVPEAIVWQYWSHDLRNENREKIIEKIETILK